MNSVIRFISLGLQDADRRLAAFLAPRPSAPIDRYLHESTIVSTIDHAAGRLSVWWLASRVHEASKSLVTRMLGESRHDYRGFGLMMLVAVAVHVALTMINGPRPGWFWLLIPGIAAICALLLVVSPRSAAKP